MLAAAACTKRAVRAYRGNIAPRPTTQIAPMSRAHICAQYRAMVTAAPTPSAGMQFYQNRQLELYASREAKRLSLRQLVFFGRSMNEERLLASANYVRTELPVRIAHRLRDLQSLPYVAVTEEGIAKVYELYWTAFEKLRKYPEIKNLKDNEAFCDFLRGMLNEHATVIPNLSLGMSLSSKHLSPEYLDSFMKRMLVSRLSRRVLVEHHIALSESLARRTQSGSSEDEEPHVGIIYTSLNVKGCIDKCARWLRERPLDLVDNVHTEWPEVIVDGHLNARFSYIRDHLEYVVFELLKNSMRATLNNHRDSSTPCPTVRATIVENPNDIGIRISDQGGGLLTSEIHAPEDLLSFSHARNSTRMDDARLGALRDASASAQGVKGTIDQQVKLWKGHGDLAPVDEQHTVPEAGSAVPPHSQMGIGLPMCNILATYFGGSIQLVSLDGWGTDVYLRLPKLGRNLEGIEL